MALYLGSSGKRKIILNGIVYCLNLYSATSTTNNGWLLSSDNHILTDSNGVYLIPSDYTEVIINNVLLSSDNYLLKDLDGLYLSVNEEE